MHPVYTPEEAHTRQTFLALMWAFSYPGRVHDLPIGDAFTAIADTLLDLETSYYTPNGDLALALSRTGARALPPDRAAYHFYPTLDYAMLPTVKSASIGTLMYPDQSATLIIGCRLGVGQTFLLEGPGIPKGTQQAIQVEGIPAEFWQLRSAANRYPRGWDIYLVSDAQIIGLPRTTQLSEEG
jgi:alpha-D-ribose 1-methylphosphonate 5-triphosphate synthase subunit PhnH